MACLTSRIIISPKDLPAPRGGRDFFLCCNENELQLVPYLIKKKWSDLHLTEVKHRVLFTRRHSFITRWRNELPNVIWREGFTLSHVKLALELDPMQPKGVQEAFQDIHAHEHAYGNAEPCTHQKVQSNAIHRERHFQAHLECLLEKDKRELLVCK